MALCALNGSVQTGKREPRVVVIESRISPVNRIVAGLASLREAGGDVIRNVAAKILRLVPIRGMARVASSVGRGEIVIVVGVATRAGSCNVGACKRPASHGVIKGVIRPCDRIVASGTIRCCEGGTRRGVRWIVGLLPGGQVATRVATIRRLNRQVIVATDMALTAGGHLAGRRQLVRIRQREASRAVIKLTVGPSRDWVAA